MYLDWHLIVFEDLLHAALFVLALLSITHINVIALPSIK